MDLIQNDDYAADSSALSPTAFLFITAVSCAITNGPLWTKLTCKLNAVPGYPGTKLASFFYGFKMFFILFLILFLDFFWIALLEFLGIFNDFSTNLH